MDHQKNLNKCGKRLIGISHVEEALKLLITSDESNNTAATVEMKLVSANALIL